jgi:ParB-like chromosome segregation protein Spo0J
MKVKNSKSEQTTEEKKETSAAEVKIELLTAGQPTFLPLNVLVSHPQIPNRQLDTSWVRELRDSIERDGLDVPLVVWNGGEENNQMQIGDEVLPASWLIAGFHRKEALRNLYKENPKRYKELFPEGVPVVVKGGELTDALFAQLREHCARKDPLPDQIFPLIRRLRDEFGLKQTQIASRIGKSDAWVSKMFEIEGVLGDAGLKEIAKGGVTIKDAQKAAETIKKARKAGQPVSTAEVLEQAKANTQALKQAGRQREEKRTSLKKVYARYKALPSMKMGARLEVLEQAFAYLAGEQDELPDLLKADVDQSPAPATN